MYKSKPQGTHLNTPIMTFIKFSYKPIGKLSSGLNKVPKGQNTKMPIRKLQQVEYNFAFYFKEFCYRACGAPIIRSEISIAHMVQSRIIFFATLKWQSYPLMFVVGIYTLHCKWKKMDDIKVMFVFKHIDQKSFCNDKIH